MEADSFVAGEFVWTGFDYLGEPTPFDQDARSSYFGIVDLCGISKDRFFLYRSYWRPEITTIHMTFGLFTSKAGKILETKNRCLQFKIHQK